MRARLLTFISKSAAERPFFMFLIIFAITIVLGGMASTIKVSTSFTEMMPSGNKKADEFEYILEEFNNASNIILLAEGDETELKKFAVELKPRIEDLSHWVDRLDMNIPVDFIKSHGLKLLKINEIKNFGSIYENPNLIPFLENLNDSFEKEYQSDEALSTKQKERDAVRFLDGIEKFIDVQRSIFNGDPIKDPGRIASDAILIGETFFMSADHRLMLITIEPIFNMVDDFQIVEEAVNGIEKVIKDIAKKHNIEAGLTGTLVLGRDEMVAVNNDSWRITILALIGIFILFVASFRIWVSPLLAIITVVFGVIWAMGISSILVDNLNMATAMMGVILVGLGIDFSIHIISGYSELRNAGIDVSQALKTALVKSGPGIITGGLTTALAFFT
ncbi:MAG: MMPL family transporter, partial [Fidelibacterota bacterium]